MANETCGELQQGPEVFEGEAWVGRQHRPVRYSVVGGSAIVEGCLILGTAEQVRDDTRRFRDENKPFGAVRPDPKYLWHKGVVPYVIAPDLPNPTRVHDAMAHWQAFTQVIKFIDWNQANDPARYPNWVTFRPATGCSSHIGCQSNGEQAINLGPECSMGNVIHEIGHTVGLFHEQSRNDRDQHITVIYDNIDPRYRHNFDQMLNNGVDSGSYDYESIMHYPKNAFSRNGKDTIVPKASKPIGQRVRLSQGDIETVKKLYEDIV